jgi:hypothetical protein
MDVYHSTFSLPLFLFSPLFLGAAICAFETLLNLWTPSGHGVFWVNYFIGHIQKFEVPQAGYCSIPYGYGGMPHI